MSYADQREGSPFLVAADCETVATCVGSREAQRSGVIRRQNRMRPRGLRTAKISLLSWAPGKPSGVTSYANSNEASPSLRAANCETVATLVGPGGSSGVVPHADQNETSPSMGAANCETDVTFGGSWEVQRSDVTRTS